MKLRNKKTGEIKEFETTIYADTEDSTYEFNSIAELNEEWEDAPEEPKGKALYWMILTLENFIKNNPDDKWLDLEDCKQMLGKLKAWKRLKDKGFEFVELRAPNYGSDIMTIKARCPWTSKNIDDLDLLFGGEDA